MNNIEVIELFLKQSEPTTGSRPIPVELYVALSHALSLMKQMEKVGEVLPKEKKEIIGQPEAYGYNVCLREIKLILAKGELDTIGKYISIKHHERHLQENKDYYEAKQTESGE
jgi:hypothetical protein